jgi:3-phenylpropionate/trans-cinnamate dioxygenase ferredoxin reductase component
MKTVIIGGSHAAISLAAQLRQLSPEAEITIVSADVEPPYQRPPLSKGYMSGKQTFEQVLLRPEDWYEPNRITLLKGARAEAVDRSDRIVTLTDGRKVAYDRLVFATGALPRRLPAEIGGHLPNVHVMRDHGDAVKLMDRMKEGARLVVIGGGYIGLEAASEAAKKGVVVTVIEAADRILKRVACAETADDIRALHKAHGVTILENAQIREIHEQNGIADGVVMADDTVIPADFIITGIGVTPDIALAGTAGLTCDNGIVVNERLETSDPQIFAMGDCAVFPYHGRMIRLESVQNANDMGVVAAHNILGEGKAYRPVPWFWSDQFELKLQIAGLNTGFDQVVTRKGLREGAKSHFYFRDGTFLAADCLNDGAAYMMARKILEGGKMLTPLQVADEGFSLKSLL